MSKQFDNDGTRLTDCCGCYSKYDEYGTLYCCKCFCEVKTGEGDGAELTSEASTTVDQK